MRRSRMPRGGETDRRPDDPGSDRPSVGTPCRTLQATRNSTARARGMMTDHIVIKGSKPLDAYPVRPAPKRSPTGWGRS